MDWAKVVGANIRQFRKECRLTQEQLAYSADLDLHYLSWIERGEHNPTVAVSGCLAAALDLHPRDFFEDVPSETI